MKLKKRIAPMITAALIAAAAVTSTASAHPYDYWSGRYIGQNDIDIRFKINTNAENDLLNWADVYSHGYDWNHISSNVNVSVAPSNISLTDGMMVSGRCYEDGSLGETVPYSSSGKVVGLGSNWDYVEIFMNTDKTIFELSSNPTAAARKTFIHEVGHALKLSHPVCSIGFSEHDIDGYPYAVMNQNYPGDKNGAVASTITNHDKSCLIAKWGD